MYDYSYIKQEWSFCCLIVWFTHSIYYKTVSKHCISLKKVHGKHINTLPINFMRLVDRAVLKIHRPQTKSTFLWVGPLDHSQMIMLYSLSWPPHHLEFLVVQSSNTALLKMIEKIRTYKLHPLSFARLGLTGFVCFFLKSSFWRVKQEKWLCQTALHKHPHTVYTVNIINELGPQTLYRL